MSSPDFDVDAKTPVKSTGRPTSVSSDVSLPKPKQSFSPRVSVRRLHSTVKPGAVKIEFAALPALNPSSPAIILQKEDPISKMDSPPHESPPRPKSCPMPLLAPPTSKNSSKMATQASSLGSSSRLSSTQMARFSRWTGMEPYSFPTCQPQPDPGTLPVATRIPRRPTYLKTARDRTTAVHGPLHPVIDNARPPPPPNPQDIECQKRRAALLALEEPAAAAILSPLELVYNTRERTFELIPRSDLLPNGDDTPMLEMQENQPPLLVDGRMTLLEVPRRSTTLVVFWRSFDGKKTKVWRRDTRLPVWVWIGRNFKDKYKECFVR